MLRRVLPLLGVVEQVAGDSDSKYGPSHFELDGRTTARNLDAFLGTPQSSEFGSVPTADVLAADRAWIDRFYEIPASRVPDRLSMANMSSATMHQNIRAGRPFIVTDMIADWPMAKWTCDSVSRDFKRERMMAWNYDPQGHSRMPSEVALGDDWQEKVMPHRKEPRYNDPVNSPSQLSFHWYPLRGGAGADEREPVSGSSASSIRQLQASYKLPAFFDSKSKLNVRFCEDRIEMFLGMPGAGAKLHSDAVCEPIFSVQVSGRKLWRLSPEPPFGSAHRSAVNDYVQKRPGGAWQPSFEFVLEAGEALFFPTSWMHETKNTPGSGCSLSASLQWRYPFPTGFIKAFGRRLMNAQETHFCYEHWAPFITGDVDGIRRLANSLVKKKVASTAFRQWWADRRLPYPLAERGDGLRMIGRPAIEAAVGARFDNIDKDGSGSVGPAEKTRHFKAVRKREQKRGSLVEFEPSFEATDWIAFHDDVEGGGDGDGEVTRVEFMTSVAELVEQFILAREQGAVDAEEEEMQEEQGGGNGVHGEF